MVVRSLFKRICEALEQCIRTTRHSLDGSRTHFDLRMSLRKRTEWNLCFHESAGTTLERCWAICLPLKEPCGTQETFLLIQELDGNLMY